MTVSGLFAVPTAVEPAWVLWTVIRKVPVEPCLKVPDADFVTESTGAGRIVTASVFEVAEGDPNAPPPLTVADKLRAGLVGAVLSTFAPRKRAG